MAFKIKKWLSTLHEISREADVSDTVNMNITIVKETLTNIFSIFEVDFADYEKGLICSHLFDQESGILRFIENALNRKKFADHVTISALTFIKNIVESNEFQIWKYVKMIQESCWNLWENTEDLSFEEIILEIIFSLISQYPVFVDQSLVKSMTVKIFSEIPKKTESNQLVLQWLYPLLGISAKHCPMILSINHKEIFNTLIDGLESQIEVVKEGGNFIISGCLIGISDYLDAFESIPPEREKINDNPSLYSKELREYDRIWTFLSTILYKLLIEYNEKCVHNVTTKACLKFISKHCSYISKYLISNGKFKSWNKSLIMWCAKEKFPEYKLAEAALESFYHEIFLLLSKKAESSQTLAQDIHSCITLGIKESVTLDEQRASIKSLGCMSTLLKAMDNYNEIDKIFTYLIRYHEGRTYWHPKRFPTASLMLPVYMEGVSHVFGNLETINIEQVIILQKLSLKLIENIPKFHSNWHVDCLRPIILISHSLSKMPKLQEVFLENFLLQALIISCSPIISSSGEMVYKLTDVNTDATICENYLLFWMELFKNPKQSVFRGMTSQNYSDTIEHLLVNLLKAALVVIENLDLDIIAVANVRDSFGSEVEDYCSINVEIANPKDLQIISNLFTLLNKIISVSGRNIPIRNFTRFIARVIYYSKKNSFIPVLYKFLSSCLSYYWKVNYLEGYPSPSVEDDDHNNLLTKIVCFMKEIVFSVNRFDYDLSVQVAQLEFLLSAPSEVVKHLLNIISSSIQTVFRFGFNYPNLILMGIEALESWTSGLEWNEWQPVLYLIMPDLYHILNISGYWNKYFTRKTSHCTKYSDYCTVNKEEDIIHQIKEKILLFLAKLPPSFVFKIACCRVIVPLESYSPWSNEKVVLFKISFPGIKTHIDLDMLLPHVLELCLNSIIEKERSAACELLFSLLMANFIGFQEEIIKPQDIEGFGWWIIPKLLQLASDHDETIRQQFCHLLLRFSNLFSSEEHLKAKTYISWIDSLMDGMSHPHDAKIRNISGVYLMKFTGVSVCKVGSKEVMNTILEKICIYSQTSNLSKRVGASLAINSLFPALLHNPILLDQFWMELLYYQVLAFEESECAVSKLIISTSLQRLGKVIMSSPNIFNKYSECRKKLPAFEGVLLKDAVYWILNKCFSIDLRCRKEILELYLSLAPFVEGCHHPQNFMTLVFERKSLREVVNIFEGFERFSVRPAWIPDSFHSLESCSRSELTSLIKWLSCLNSCLDSYKQCILENLFDPSQIFHKKLTFITFDTLCNFLHIFKNICMSFILKLPEYSDHCSYSKGDKEVVQVIANLENVFIKILEFLSVVIQKCQSEVLLLENFGIDFKSCILMLMDIINMYVFEESFRETVLMTKEFKFQFKNLVEVIKKYLSVENYQIVLKCLKDYFLKGQNLPLISSENMFCCEICDEQMILARNLLFLYDCHLLVDMLKDDRFKNIKELNILKHAFNSLFQVNDSKTTYKELSKSNLLYIETFLKLSFVVDPQVDSIISLSFDENEVEGLYSEKSMVKGEYFYFSFKSCILTSLISNMQRSIDYLLKHLGTERGEDTLSIWWKIWTDIISDERAKIIFAEDSLLVSILEYVTQLLPWTKNTFIRKLAILRALLYLPLGVMNPEKWLSFEGLGLWCINLFVSQSESIIIKAKILELLSYFSHQKFKDKLRKALQHTLKNYFSCEMIQILGKNSEATSDIILKSALIGLERNFNSELVWFFVLAWNRNSRIGISDFKKFLSRVIQKSDPGKQSEVMSSINSLLSDGTMNSYCHITSVKIFLQLLIEVSDLDAAKTFYSSNIKLFVNILQKDFEIQSISLLKLQLVSKIICFHLVEALFLRFGKSLELLTCPISVAYNDGKPNEKQLIRELTLRGWEARKTINSQVNGACDLFLQYRCAAYNALTAIISNLKEEVKPYAFLFEENLDDGDMIWDGLVDTSFDIIFSRSLEKRTIWLRTTNDERDQSRYGGSLSIEWDMESGDSLGICIDDISNLALRGYDFNDCSIRAESWSLEAAMGSALEEKALSCKYIEHILNHVCMEKIYHVIKHMVEKKIIPSSKDSVTPPIWVRSIKETFEDKNKHRNVKVFLMTVVLNCEKFYSPYAKHIFQPIMECMKNGDFGFSINQLLENVVKLIISWNELINTEVNEEIISELFNLFILDDEDLEREKFETYLSLIRSMLKVWHGPIKINQQKLFLQIKSNAKNCRCVEYGLLVCSILMENSVTPWEECNKDRFLELLLLHLDSNKEGIQKVSAYLTGLILRQVDPFGEFLTEEEDLFIANIIKYLKKNAPNHKEKFLICLNEIQKNYVHIINKFLPTVLYELPKLCGYYRTISLDMISRIEIAGNPFLKLKEAGLLTWLAKEDTRDQEIAIDIIKRNIAKFEYVELKEISDHLFDFHKHTNAKCRGGTYEILCYTCEKYRKANETEKVDNSWINTCERILLLGLVDEDVFISDLVSSFWMEKGGFSSHNLTEYLVSILQLVLNLNIQKYCLDIVISLLLLHGKGKYHNYFHNLDSQEHRDDNKGSSSGLTNSKMKEGNGKNVLPKDWKMSGSNEMRKILLRKERKVRRRHHRESIYEMYRSFCVTDPQEGYKKISFHLRALAKGDPVFGRQLLISLINVILETAIATYDRSSNVWTDLEHALNKVLKETTCVYFIGAVLEVCKGKHYFINLDNEMVFFAGQTAPLSILACVYLESKLINNPCRLQTRILNRSEEIKNDSDVWIWISKLYQHMDETDIVHGILVDCIQPREKIRKALEFERNESWTEAMPYFQEVLNSSETGNFIFQEKELYCEAYFRCLANLSQWEQIKQDIHKQLKGSYCSIWENQMLAHDLLPWTFASCIRTSLEPQGKSEEFLRSVCSWMENEHRSNFLKAYCIKDLAVLCFLYNKLDQAKYLIAKTFSKFHQKLGCFLRGSYKNKMATALLDIQLLRELSLFLSILDSPQKDLNSFEKFCSSWVLSSACHLEPLCHWEERIAFRNMYISKIKEVLNGGAEESLSVPEKIEELSLTMVQHITETAIARGNYQVTKKYLKKTEKLLGCNSDPTLRLPWLTSYGKMSAILADGKPNLSPEKISSLVKSVNFLGKLLNNPELDSNHLLKINIHGKLLISLKDLSVVLKDHETIFELVDESRRKQFFKLINYSDGRISLNEKVTMYGIMCVKDAFGITETLSDKLLSSEAYLSIGKYCWESMKHSSENLAEICLQAFLRAMFYGSKEARDWFPCILSFDFSKESLRVLFKNEASHVPLWMFLSWKNQIFSHLKRYVCDALEDIVIKLCEFYPAAIFIPYKLNLQKYEECVSLMILNQRISRIISKYRTMEEVIHSLMYVCNPETMFTYHLDKIISLLEKPKPNVLYVKEACMLMMEELFPSEVAKNFHGKLLDGLKSLKENLEELFGKNLCQLENLDLARSSANILQLFKKELKKNTVSSSLEDYSHWLAKFRIFDHMDAVEIPGQYTGDREPIPEFHTKIYAFLPTVTEVSSLENSVSLSILGTDGREHRFLMKYGKDLKLDLRFGKILGVMNNCLLNDLSCIKRDLKLDINQFIPLSSHHGLIKWHSKLMPLIDVITMSVRKSDAEKRKVVLNEYYRWLKKDFRPEDTLISIYKSAFLHHSRDETVIHYEKLIQSLPFDNLLSSFLKLSQSTEDFYCFRSSFSSSYAVECIVYWLLGVGECNFSRIAMNCHNGRVSCIDFGCSFGSTVYSSPVPELMPFLLPPQILRLMQPFGEIGFIKGTMINTLRALQGRYDIILSIITVMLKEPYLDWSINFKVDYSIEKSTNFVWSSNWNSDEILRITSKKFKNGINPTMVILELLSWRINDEVHLKEMIEEVVRGNYNYNIRAVFQDKGLSCEQQISSLLDLATDYHILGKTLINWENNL